MLEFLSHMKPPLNPSSSMFFLLVPLLISIPTSLGAVDDRYTNCKSNYFSCGGIQNLTFTYPFWGGERPNYCGLPDFKLTCENNIPMIIIQSLKYRILHLDWTSQILVLARDDYFDTICPRDYKNNTFDQTEFKYADGLANVTFLYDCTSTKFQSNIVKNCQRDGSTYTTVYYVLDSVYISSCKSVIMPIYQAHLPQAAMPDQIQGAVEGGFGLQWIVNNEKCDNCSKSGGECGYDGQFSCFCEEGPQNTSCSPRSSGMLLLSGSPMFICSCETWIWDMTQR